MVARAEDFSGRENLTFEEEGIFGLKKRIESLSGPEKDIAGRILYVDDDYGIANPPSEMTKLIEKLFGPDGVTRVQKQRIVRVDNKVTREGALFNELRASRPIQNSNSPQLGEIIEDGRKNDSFSTPQTLTPEDDFGRVQGEFSITASNLAKYDIRHGVVIFNEFDPLRFSEEQVVDYLRTVREYWRVSHEMDPKAVYPFLTWNCLGKSGASIIHGHMQPVLARGRHYEGAERLREDALYYKQVNKGANYFTDEAFLYDKLGLMIRKNGATIMADLTPIKEKGIKMYATKFDDELSRVIAHLLDCYTKKLNVESFNLTMATPPLEETKDDWSDFPIVVNLVDRGNPTSLTADMGGVEIAGKMSVVSADPYKVHAALI